MGPGHGRSKGPQRQPAALRCVAAGGTGLAPVLAGPLPYGATSRARLDPTGSGPMRGVSTGGAGLRAVGAGPLPYGATGRTGLARTRPLPCRATSRPGLARTRPLT
ncbi:hypothetical protein [Streptomyces sp. DSM 40484]|uniref:hypothetical protein n=1 Tax=Streptomyces kroppenstedtii TaxID=3051181 RepID=UPI0028D57BEE|nr:hypothetical protein [Streptomyces sp. DSM 40484]